LGGLTGFRRETGAENARVSCGLVLVKVWSLGGAMWGGSASIFALRCVPRPSAQGWYVVGPCRQGRAGRDHPNPSMESKGWGADVWGRYGTLKVTVALWVTVPALVVAWAVTRML
jgi:hypothetical protein